MTDLYWDDVLLWLQQQARLLRRLAAGEHVNDQIDWDNLAEEVESFRAQARRRFAPSMRQRLDLPAIYADALRAIPDTNDGPGATTPTGRRPDHTG